MHRLKRKLNVIFNLNLADAIIELMAAAVLMAHLFANYNNVHDLSKALNRVNIYVFMALDFILQVTVLVASSDPSIRRI